MKKRYGWVAALVACLMMSACGASGAAAQKAAEPSAASQQEGSAPSTFVHSITDMAVLDEAGGPAGRQTAAPEESLADVSAVEWEESLPGTFLSETELGVIDAINEERKALGLGTLTYNWELTKASRVRSEELFRTKHWDHSRPDGASWVTVIKEDVPLSFLSAGENLATVTYNDQEQHYEADAAWWFTEWKNSPSHYNNIIRPEFNSAGVGIYFVEQEDGVKVAYATTLFAQIEA